MATRRVRISPVLHSSTRYRNLVFSTPSATCKVTQSARIRPNVPLGSARQHVTIRPDFGKHSASFVALHLRRFALAAGVNSTKVNILTLSY